jgi:hypothetical protein
VGERGRGTVWIAYNDGRYTAYWDLDPDGPPTMLEQAPESAELSAMLVWARDRSPVVLVRPKRDPSEYYWAGVGDAPAAHAQLKRLPKEDEDSA